MKKLILFVVLLYYFDSLNGTKLNTQPFPKNFLFGVTSSAYQVEGSWNADGKTANVWDIFTHTHPDKISGKSNADISCDSYKYFKLDIQALKRLNVNVYKFSLSWSRILPNGKMNHEALDYYNELIDGLISNNIKPMVTLFHWDTPDDLHKLGGWSNPFVGHQFLEYARLAFDTFGDRVKYWITFNDPFTFCLRSNADENFPPTTITDEMGTYLCSNVIIETHANVYRLYNNTFKPTQKGLLSISLKSSWFEPSSSNQDDIKASESLLTFTLGQFATPIYLTGNYPTEMQDVIEKRSLSEGFLLTRLRKFSSEEAARIKGSADFFALNFDTEIKTSARNYHADIPSFHKDVGVEPVIEEKWNVSSTNWIKPAPNAFRKILNKIKMTYGNIPIYVTECGFPDNGNTEDYDKVNFHQTYLSALLDAFYEDNVNVIGYNIRSLLDCFEWNEGYTIKYGLFQVDLDNEDKERIPKLSSVAYKEIIQNGKLPSDSTTKPQ